MTLDLYCLGKVPWHESQLCYHALAGLGREALVLVSPLTRYASIGYNQDAEQELDLDFCEANDIPVFRREVGGGAVYLDGNQLFFQIVLRRDSPLVPLRRETFYRKFLQPPIQVYRSIGIPAEYEPINDILAGGKKISGTGAGELDDCVVFVGNLMWDFDYETMSRILKSPDEEFRRRIQKTIEQNLTTIRRELGDKEASCRTESELGAMLIEEFQKVLGPLRSRAMDAELKDAIAELGRVMITDEWLFGRRRKYNGSNTRIRSGVNIIHKIHRSNGSLIRADFEIRGGTYKETRLSVDALYPEELLRTLERTINGKSAQDLESALEEVWSSRSCESSGIRMEDWLNVLKI